MMVFGFGGVWISEEEGYGADYGDPVIGSYPSMLGVLECRESGRDVSP